MQNYIRKRAVKMAQHILRTSATVRQTAEVFGISKSTVHKDVSERLPRIDEQLAQKVKSILEKNKAERHIRGGEATRQKYASSHSSKNITPAGQDISS
ncbi:MAG: sporulation transcriptional regulator SpoIIID [Syntrophomonadaceae bacterium]